MVYEKAMIAFEKVQEDNANRVCYNGARFKGCVCFAPLDLYHSHKTSYLVRRALIPSCFWIKET